MGDLPVRWMERGVGVFDVRQRVQGRMTRQVARVTDEHLGLLGVIMVTQSVTADDAAWCHRGRIGRDDHRTPRQC